jgi:hypothetical protein
MERWRHRHGDMDMEAWPMETWTHGHGDMYMETWTMELGHGDMEFNNSKEKRKPARFSLTCSTFAHHANEIL